MSIEGGGRAVIAAVCASLLTATAGADGGAPVFARVGDDVVARFFHAAGPIDDGVVLVTGGMRLQFLPPSLVSLSGMSAVAAAAEDSPISVAIGDLDGVNGLDLAVANSASDDVSVLLNIGAQCSTDIDANGLVDFDDLTTLLGASGVCDGCSADFDGSGTVGFEDLTTLLGTWGPCL